MLRALTIHGLEVGRAGAASMKQTLLYEKYPLFVLELGRDETELDSVDAICDYFRERIEAHRCGRFIAVFDLYGHTWTLPEGQVSKDIRAA